MGVVVKLKKMSNTSGCCDSDLGLPIGLTGAVGAPGFHSMSYTLAGSPFSAATTTYEEAGRFVFSNTFAAPFTGLKTNVWVSGGTGSMRIIDLITSDVVYETTAITSTSAVNIETAIGLSIYNVASAILAVQVKASASQTISIATSLFYYNP